jgi:tetratricopeptide (TPR) repeat protein
LTVQRHDLATIFRQAMTDHRAGRLQQAEAGYRRILAADPGHGDSLHYLGLIAAQVGRHDVAADLIARAVASRPGVPDYHNNLGLSLMALGRFEAAADAHRHAIRLEPSLAAAHSNLGNALKALGRPEEAAASCRQALELLPGFAAAHNNLGAALADLDRLGEAEACYRSALRCEPAYPEAYNNLGNAARGQGRWQEAVGHIRQALALAPDYVEAHYNLAWSLLLNGDYAEGWREFEWRWRLEAGAPARASGVPQWRGEPLGDRVLLLHAEQGAGDTLMFCRYAALAARLGRVLLEVPAPLVELLSGLPGLAGVYATGTSLPAFDLQCPLLSLPLAFGTEVATIPADVPYLRADPARVAQWRRRLLSVEGRRVGLAWAGNPAQRDDRRRSIPLASLAPLGEVPGIAFVSLQKGRRDAPPAGMRLHDWTDELHDYADTAALIEALDLVIGVDTGVVHLAGALGRPVWVMNRFDPYFAWLLERADSPWYPTLRQFRQTVPGQWTAVIEAVRNALAAAG